MADKIPYFDIEIDTDVTKIEKGCLKVLEELRPAWNKEEIKYKPLTEGLVNTMMLCRQENDTEIEDGIMFRIHGASIGDMLSRKSEYVGLQIGSAVNVGPRILARFKNGICLSYLRGSSLQFKDMQEEKIMGLIFKAVARLHAVDVSKLDLVDYDGNPCQPDDNWPYFDAFDKMLPNIQPYDTIKDEAQRERIITEFPPLEDIVKDYKHWQAEIHKLQFPAVLCHNDVHHRNTIYDEKKGELHLVDFEVFGYNYQTAELVKNLDFKDFFVSLGMASAEDKDMDLDKFTAHMKNYLREYYLIKRGNGFVSDLDLRRAVIECQIFSMFLNVAFLLFALYSLHTPIIKTDSFQFALTANKKYASCKHELPKAIEEYKKVRKLLDDEQTNNNVD